MDCPALGFREDWEASLSHPSTACRLAGPPSVGQGHFSSSELPHSHCHQPGLQSALCLENLRLWGEGWEARAERGIPQTQHVQNWTHDSSIKPRSSLSEWYHHPPNLTSYTLGVILDNFSPSFLECESICRCCSFSLLYILLNTFWNIVSPLYQQFPYP